MPHLGRDAVMAMAHLLTLLQTTVARSIDPAQPALLTIGRVEAGHQRNILAGADLEVDMAQDLIVVIRVLKADIAEVARCWAIAL